MSYSDGGKESSLAALLSIILSPEKNDYGRMGYSLVVAHLPRMFKALGSIPSTTTKKKKKNVVVKNNLE